MNTSPDNCTAKCSHYFLYILFRIPRRQVKFIGTIRFASRSCHLGKEQCRRDDLEAWVYMLIEFTQYAILPWSRTINRETVLREKQRLFNGKCSSLHRRFH
ncbi:unnamed protein product [Anisakis simplex]|uniref:Uncharacterized protein n=1 Tax=Anisakis simplex TaxID=6269 RepID=A0A0M3JF97_ANISI|nr:unnamed protein product [Anisakis simplex]